MEKREKLVHLALLTLGAYGAVLVSGEAAAVPKKGAKPVECFGVNSCKGTNGCAISPEQISVANKVFNKKFAKSKPTDCAGNSDGSAKTGFLAWTSKSTADECFSGGGFLLEKDANGKIVVREKSGTKS